MKFKIPNTKHRLKRIAQNSDISSKLCFWHHGCTDMHLVTRLGIKKYGSQNQRNKITKSKTEDKLLIMGLERENKKVNIERFPNVDREYHHKYESFWEFF